jgi:hypothetical protein
MFGYALLLDFRDNLTRCSGFPFIPLFTISETITLMLDTSDKCNIMEMLDVRVPPSL